MDSTIHIKTKILPGKKVEIEIPQGLVGQEVEVFVVFPEQINSPSRCALDIINQAGNKQKLFQSAAQVDQYLKEERDSWEL